MLWSLSKNKDFSMLESNLLLRVRHDLIFLIAQRADVQCCAVCFI